MQPQAFYRAVADDFSAVDGIIKKQLTSKVPLVSKIGDYITSAGGKRLRPLLVLLCGKALGREGDDLRLLAATIEFLHTATLLHDDVVDMSGMRRGRETANAMWGNAPSVLVGDFLYSRSFEMMVELGSMPVMKILSQATRIIAEGEVLQLSKVREASTTEQLRPGAVTARLKRDGHRHELQRASGDPRPGRVGVLAHVADLCVEHEPVVESESEEPCPREAAGAVVRDD